MVTTTSEVKAPQVMGFLKEEIKKGKFPDGSHFRIYCGNHGTEDGKLGDESHDLFFKAIETGITLLEVELEKSNIHTFEFEALRIDVYNKRQKVKLGDVDIVKKKYQKLANRLFDATTNSDSDDQKRHTVMVFAYCFSDYNEFKEFLQESGVVSVIMVKNERGEITNGKCFQLDGKQGKLLRIVQKDHLNAEYPYDLKVKHVFLSGSFGTGKTVVLVEICWMRINYLLRRIRDKKAGEGK